MSILTNDQAALLKLYGGLLVCGATIATVAVVGSTISGLTVGVLGGYAAYRITKCALIKMFAHKADDGQLNPSERQRLNAHRCSIAVGTLAGVGSAAVGAIGFFAIPSFLSLFIPK